MKQLKELFKDEIVYEIPRENLLILCRDVSCENQQQTKEAFSEKWSKAHRTYHPEAIESFYQFQKEWFLKLYGFSSETELQNFLKDKRYIFDAGCGLGYKARWFSELAPEATVIGMDLSDSVFIAADMNKDKENLFFIQGDISNTKFKDEMFDFINCDQVLHHVEDPPKTLEELVRILKPGGEITLYVYARKALPRELLDEYFRTKAKELSHEELWELSKALTTLGKRLSELNIKIQVPDIPLLGIKEGTYDLQRFIYYNFMKCFWNPKLGWKNSVMINFDWYSPSNAYRYSEKEFKEMAASVSLKPEYFHAEPACYSGRFSKV